MIQNLIYLFIWFVYTVESMQGEGMKTSKGRCGCKVVGITYSTMQHDASFGMQIQDITLFKSITMLYGTDNVLKIIFSTLSLNDEILCIILLVPHNIGMDMNHFVGISHKVLNHYNNKMPIQGSYTYVRFLDKPHQNQVNQLCD